MRRGERKTGDMAHPVDDASAIELRMSEKCVVVGASGEDTREAVGNGTQFKRPGESMRE